MSNTKKILVEINGNFSLNELANKIKETIKDDEAPYFIALLEKSYKNWDVAESLIKHFKEVEITYKDGLKKYNHIEDLSPKSLL